GSVLIAGTFQGSLAWDDGATLIVSSASKPFASPFLLKLFPDGNGAVLQQFASSGTVEIHGVATDDAGNVYLGGHTRGSVGFDVRPTSGQTVTHGGSDLMLVKLDPNWRLVWQRLYGDAHDQFFRTMAVDAEGDIAVAGTFSGAIDFGT